MTPTAGLTGTVGAVPAPPVSPMSRAGRGAVAAIERAAIEAVAGFWAGVLDWPGGVTPAVRPVLDDATHADPADAGGPKALVANAIIAVVGIGGYPGRIVRVTCDERLGIAAAVRAFGAESPQPADVDDTVKELANVVAGAVKAVADGATTMTLPMCARAAGGRRRGTGDDVVHEGSWVASTGDWLVVEVVARCAEGGRS